MKPTIVFVTLAAAAGAASGQVVFVNPWDANQTDAGAFSQPSQVLAGEFDLTANALVSAASWRGTMFSPDPLDTGDTWNFDVIFYDDNGGVPGNSFATQSVVALVTDTGVDLAGERVYIFDASFAPVNLAGNTTYFFTALNTGATDTFRWNMGTDTSYSAWFSSNGGSWNDLDNRSPLNFSLLVPAPGALALLGVAGIAATRRRR